jgi:hypothetical protein
LARRILYRRDKGNAAEVGRLKGEMEAIEQASIRENRGFQFQQAVAQ